MDVVAVHLSLTSEAVLEHERRDVRREQLPGLHPRGRRQLIAHRGCRARTPLAGQRCDQLKCTTQMNKQSIINGSPFTKSYESNIKST